MVNEGGGRNIPNLSKSMDGRALNWTSERVSTVSKNG